MQHTTNQLLQMAANNTDFFSKTDILQIWGFKDYRQFERVIGRDFLEKIGWKKGYQIFSPKQVRAIIEELGEPITKAELLSKK